MCAEHWPRQKGPQPCCCVKLSLSSGTPKQRPVVAQLAWHEGLPRVWGTLHPRKSRPHGSVCGRWVSVQPRQPWRRRCQAADPGPAHPLSVLSSAPHSLAAPPNLWGPCWPSDCHGCCPHAPLPQLTNALLDKALSLLYLAYFSNAH